MNELCSPETQINNLQAKIDHLRELINRPPNTIADLQERVATAKALQDYSRGQRLLAAEAAITQVKREFEDSHRAIVERAAGKYHNCPCCFGSGITKVQGYLRFDARTNEEAMRACFLCKAGLRERI